jgi:hypothetical protein
LLPTIETVGDFLAAFLIASAILLLVIAFQLGKQIKGALKKLVEDRLKTRYLPGSRKTV